MAEKQKPIAIVVDDDSRDRNEVLVIVAQLGYRVYMACCYDSLVKLLEWLKITSSLDENKIILLIDYNLTNYPRHLPNVPLPIGHLQTGTETIKYLQEKNLIPSATTIIGMSAMDAMETARSDFSSYEITRFVLKPCVWDYISSSDLRQAVIQILSAADKPVTPEV